MSFLTIRERAKQRSVDGESEYLQKWMRVEAMNLGAGSGPDC